MAWQKLATLSEFGDEEVIARDWGTEMIALYRIDGEIFATSNLCTHAFSLLHEGTFDGCTIECPLHQALFDIKTGEVLEGPADQNLRTYPVRLEGEDILVDL